MWQRIQTLYLFISTILIGCMFFMTKATMISNGGSGLEEIKYTAYVPYLILLIVIAILNILALTGFKIRVFQFRTAVLTAIVTLALQAWLAIDYFVADESLVFKASAIFPLVAVVLDVLAARGIMSDMLIADSMNRLRSRKKNGKLLK